MLIIKGVKRLSAGSPYRARWLRRPPGKMTQHNLVIPAKLLRLGFYCWLGVQVRYFLAHEVAPHWTDLPWVCYCNNIINQWTGQARGWLLAVEWFLGAIQGRATTLAKKGTRLVMEFLSWYVGKILNFLGSVKIFCTGRVIPYPLQPLCTKQETRLVVTCEETLDLSWLGKFIWCRNDT